ncbi:MAG: aldehyde dehydrogenase [Acidobacteria bacterium ACB1]|nr:2-aminomuconic 6-semialdehyde dehydrogenase [Pyrinomonadaceae bacterium]MCE7962470.1 aldehyde dehydrogenase [Acidobacteria bacterium ACB1]RIJ93743.1 MAG: 2-hydroxymuconic semialdehyde dehydrogenase [Acidobacteriota bacterium]
MEQIQNYIGGELVEPASQGYLENFEPATGEVYSLIADSDERDVEAAAAAAKAAFPAWSTTSSEERFAILMRLCGLIERDLEILAQAESRDNGKPITLARTIDIPRAVANFRFYATAAMHLANESHDTVGRNAINYTLRQPLGVVGCISPWNLPLYLFTWKIAPAIAAGCTVVAKPSEVTPMTAQLLSKLCIEAGLPAGVLNIVHGLGPKVGSAIVGHRDTKAISFTGGTKTGEEIARTAAPMFKKLSLELGGKNPNIIFADCNYEEMLATSVRSSFSNQGEICLCGSRIFVERPLYDRFRNDFVERVKALKVGDPADDGTDVGAIVSKQHFDKIMSYIELAKKEGGEILTGGNSILFPAETRNHKGWFIEPTVIEGLPFDCRTNQEEIFGPVVTIQPFDSEEEVLGYANSVRYGLSATVWTENLSRAHRMAASLESGIVWINCWLLRDLRTPFGGLKDSGVGREGGFEAVRFFTEEKNVCVKISSE